MARLFLCRPNPLAPYLLGVLLVTGHPFHPASAQTHVNLEVQQSGCLLDQSLRTTIGDSDDPDGILFAEPLQILELHGDRYLLLTTAGGPPRVFDSNGSFLRFIGGSGRGPGEFLRPSRVLQVPGDSLLVLDPGQSRALVISPDQGTRTILGLPSIFEIDRLQWPKVVAVSDLQAAGEEARTFQVLNLSGARISYDSGLGSSPGDRPAWHSPERWALHGVDEGRFWAVGGLSYSLELWNTNGSRELHLRRDLQEYDPANRSGVGNPNRPPPAYAVSISTDSTGLLWVFLHVPRYDWRNAWEGVEITPNGEVSLRRNEDLIHDLYQTRLDIVDPQNNALVYSRLLPSLTVPFHGGTDPRIAKYRIREDFVPVIEIWDLALDCSGRSR